MLIISDYSRKSENYRCSYFHKEPFQISQIWSECLSLGNPNIFYQLKIWLLSGHKRKVCLAGFFLLHSYSWMKFNEVLKKNLILPTDSPRGSHHSTHSSSTSLGATSFTTEWSEGATLLGFLQQGFHHSSFRILCTRSIPKTLNSNFGSFDKLL